MAPEKTCGSSTNISFAGIELDTLLSEARLPPEKLEKCKSIISDFVNRKKSDTQRNTVTQWSSEFCMFRCKAWAIIFAPFDRSNN